MKLTELQHALLQYVTGRACRSSLAHEIVSTANGSASTRLSVYRSTVSGAHHSALASAFPVVREILGSRYWKQLLESDLPRLGTASPNLHHYGSFVPAMLQKAVARRSELQDFDYLADLAELEWYVHRTKFLADEPEFDWASFNELSLEEQAQVTFLTSGTLFLFSSRYAVDSVWHSHRQSVSNTTALSAEVTYCCICRRKPFDVTVERVTRKDFERLQRLQQGINLNDFSDQAGDSPGQLVETLFTWITNGYIVGYEKTCDV